jgi:hypothetical protein
VKIDSSVDKTKIESLIINESVHSTCFLRIVHIPFERFLKLTHLE